MRVAIAIAIGAALAAASTHDSDTRFDGIATDQVVQVSAARSEQLARENAAIAPAAQLFRYERAPLCREAAGIWTRGSADGTCPELANTAGALRTCPEGDSIVMPMWRQARTSPEAPWGEWTQIDSGGCGVDLLPELTEADFRLLPIPAPTLTLQPDRGWVLVNIETIVTTSPDPITLRTDLLGHGITVEATPTTWTYDFGDGHTLTTKSPGHPYPHHDVFHEYETPGTTTITLTATWTGRYLIDGTTTWRDIDGTATTTTTSTPITIEERTSRLVATHCNTRPKPTDC
jgi:hypothetical protein